MVADGGTEGRGALNEERVERPDPPPDLLIPDLSDCSDLGTEFTGPVCLD